MFSERTSPSFVVVGEARRERTDWLAVVEDLRHPHEAREERAPQPRGELHAAEPEDEAAQSGRERGADADEAEPMQRRGVAPKALEQDRQSAVRLQLRQGASPERANVMLPAAALSGCGGKWHVRHSLRRGGAPAAATTYALLRR